MIQLLIKVIEKSSYCGVRLAIFWLALALIAGTVSCAGVSGGEPEPIWDWYDLNNKVRNNLGGTYKLMNDLDKDSAGYEEVAGKTANKGQGWIPIGGSEFSAFNGRFNGNKHMVRDLVINTDKAYVGLFGCVGGRGVIENVSVVNVTVTGGEFVGALAGRSDGTVINCDSSGSVNGNRVVGGLVGWNEYGKVRNCHSTVTVEGTSSVGGLVGWNDKGTVSNSYSTARVTGQEFIGGLVGNNDKGTVSNSYSTANVAGEHFVGGLAGYNKGGTVSNSYSNSRVSGDRVIGGLVGYNEGTIVSNSSSTGRVTGREHVGGLVGYNSGGTVSSNSRSSASVEGMSYVGGLVGHNSGGTVSKSYSVGSVAGNRDVGGLVGRNSGGTVSNCYATGNATGISSVGGLVGRNDRGATVSNSYATGAVTATSFAGGLVGYNSGGTVSNSFWDKETSGMQVSDGGTGKTTTEMRSLATFTETGREELKEPWNIVAVDPGTTNPAYIWNIVNGQTYPFLS